MTLWAMPLSAGFSWPIKYGAASYLYLVWFGVVLLVFAATQALNGTLHVGQAIAFGFVLQQVSLITRTAAHVGWNRQ